MNPSYTKVPADFLYKGERLMSDAEWEKKKKENAEKQRQQAIENSKKEKLAEIKAKKDKKIADAKEDKARKDNRCPHCGQDRRSGDTGDTKVEEVADKEKRERERYQAWVKEHGDDEGDDHHNYDEYDPDDY